MKKIIITRKQLKEIADSEKPVLTSKSPSSNVSDIANTLRDEYRNANSTLKQNSIFTTRTPNNNEPNESETQVAITDIQNPTEEIQNFTNNGGNPDKACFTHQMEGKRFTKKQLEEARIANIKNNGKTYTKKQINESFNDEEFREDVKDFCENNEFIYIIYFPLKGYITTACSTENVRASIINDIMNSPVFELTHEQDSLLQNKHLSEEYDVIKLIDSDTNKPFYIVYEYDE